MTSNPDTLPGGSDFLRRATCFFIQCLAPASAWSADRRSFLNEIRTPSHPWLISRHHPEGEDRTSGINIGCGHPGA